jgi:hypothetical protein
MIPITGQAELIYRDRHQKGGCLWGLGAGCKGNPREVSGETDIFYMLIGGFTPGCRHVSESIHSYTAELLFSTSKTHLNN